VCTDAHSTAAAAAAATTAGTASTAGATAAAAAGTTDTSSARSVFAVFDGHGSKGREASALCAARLEKALAARLTQLANGNSSGNSNPACSLSSVGMSFSGSSASLSINGSTASTAASSPYSSITSSSGSNSNDKIGPVGCALAYVCWQLQKELQSTAKLDCANVSVYCHIRQLYCSAIVHLAPRPTYCGNTDCRLYMPVKHGVTELLCRTVCSRRVLCEA
jgi:hypothetical protein